MSSRGLSSDVFARLFLFYFERLPCAFPVAGGLFRRRGALTVPCRRRARAFSLGFRAVGLSAIAALGALGPEASVVTVGRGVFVFPVPQPPSAGTAAPRAASPHAPQPAPRPHCSGVVRCRLKTPSVCADVTRSGVSSPGPGGLPPLFLEVFPQDGSCFFLAHLRGFWQNRRPPCCACSSSDNPFPPWLLCGISFSPCV